MQQPNKTHSVLTELHFLPLAFSAKAIKSIGTPTPLSSAAFPTLLSSAPFYFFHYLNIFSYLDLPFFPHY